MKKRVLSMFMALALCLTLVPTAALAEENTTEPSTQLTEPTPVPQEPKTPDQGENTETPDQPEEPSQDEPPAADEPPAVQSEPAPQAAEVPAENAVAQVGNVNYANITAAFAAVKKNGGTLKLLADCETSNTSKQFDISGNYTLDLNGWTLTACLALKTKESNLTIQDSKGGGKLQAPGDWDALTVDAGNATIKSGTLASGSKGSPISFGDWGDCGTLNIEDGSFETGRVHIGYDGGKTVISGGAFHELQVYKVGDKKSNVSISGGTFDTVTLNYGITEEDILASGYTFVYQSDGSAASTLTNVKVVSQETANALVSLTVDGTETPYRSFEKALTAAQERGGTLTLLNHVTTEQVNVNSGTFTLDLNGHTLTSGDYNTLVVGGGSVTIQDSKVGGVISNTRSDGIAVYCYGGNVTIFGGSFPSKLHWEESGTVSLQGGAFRSLDSKAGSWLSAIPEGKALERDGQITDASAKTIIAPTGFYVLADHEKHDWQAGKCACGREHTDHTWEDGKCTVCHLPCSHGTISGDGVCETCGTQFAVRDDDGDYYKHLSDALARESVDDVTLVADDTLSADVMLIKNIMFFPNGHTVSGGGSIVVPSGKRLELREKNETEKAGNAGAIRVEDDGLLVVNEDFTGTVQTLTVSEKAEVELLGGTYGTITGLREKAGTLLYNGNNYALAFKKQDGSFARYDQRISSKTPLENVTVDFCRHEQLTEACDGACEYCNGALGARIGSQGYWNLNTEGDGAVDNVKNGETIVLLKDSDQNFGSFLKSDRAYTIDLKGHSTIKGWTVSAGAPKIVDSKGGGKISQLSIHSSLDLTLADLLPKGWDFQKSDGNWLSTTELKGKTASNVTVAQLPIQSMNYPTEMSMTYGGAGTLLVNVKSTGAVTFQWYKVEDGKETAVGSATPKSQFNLAEQKLSAGKHIFRFSATCDGYQKMSQDIVITVQKADIGSNRITPPTAQENLTYTGHEQALITAGSVTNYGTMQYSLTENGTYSPDIPVGTDAGAYTVWYRVIGDENHNDTAPASVAIRIGQKLLTITGVTAASKPYDGTTDAGIPSVTFDNVTLTRDTDYTVTASFDDAGVGNVKSITAIVSLMGQAAKNYALEQSSFPTTASITKAAAPDFTKETALTIVNGYEKTYTVTLPALPTLETPKEYGAPTYELGEIKLNDGYYTSGAKVENGALTLPIQKNDVKTTGSVGTVTVVIKSANYEDITLTVNVSAKNRITPTGTPTLSKNAIIYGDALNTIALSGKLHDNVNNVDVDGTFEWVDGTHIPVVGNGTYAAEWIFEPTDTEKYLTVSGRSNITVEKATQYGKVSMAGYTYGQAPSTPTLTDRTGDANAQVTYRYSTAGSGSVQTWDIQNPPALNAGTYRMYASIGDTDNYYGFEAVYCEFVVAKATPTYTAPTGLTAKYGQTLADVTLPDGWSWMDSSESVGGASTAAKTFQAKFTPKDTENYNTVENIELEVTVNKADGGNLKTVELEQKYTDASDHTYTPDWAGLPAGQDWTFSSEASIVLSKQDFAADGSLLTYAISGGKAGDKITIALKASCDNYKDFTITLNVTLTEKDDQKPLTITGAGSVVYGQTLTLTTTGGSGTGTVTYRIDTDASTGEATIDPETGVLTPVKVGSVSVIATKAGDNDYNDVTSAPFVLMIKPATPTGEPNYTKITTSGKTLKDAALTTKGSTLNPSDGKLEWVDDKGNVLPDSTRVEANTTYKWHFTPTDTNYTTLTGEVELYHKSSSGGGWYDSYYTIKATAGAGGSISPSGNVSVREGRDQPFTITPDKGYAVANVKIDGKSIGAVKSYTFENVSRTHTIEVIFMKANGNPQTGVFVDVATGSYYEDAVDWAVENGITQGTDDTHFAPDGICTRAQAVAFLWRAAGSPKLKTRTMPFTDVPAGSYYYDAVLWAVENGIAKGTSDTTFSPNMTCSRAQIVTFLWRSEKSPAAGTANPFADVKSTAYYAGAVLWAVKEDITKGTTNTTFSPDADCTRAQIVTFLWRCKK